MIDYIEEFAPSLRDRYMTLQPFEDVINSLSAGPQPQAKYDDQTEPVYFNLDFSIWKDGSILVLTQWKVTSDRVILITDDGEFDSSMNQLWNFLRQLPRPATSFTI